MKYAFISVLCAISTLSVEGFLPSSPSKESLSSLKLFKSTKSKFTPEDVAVDEFIIAMLKASKFVYLFRNVRDVVRDHDDSVGVADRSAEEAKRGFFSRPIKKVKFNRPELIITDKGAQKVVENRFLKYPITAAAMKEFFNLNRRFFTEDSKGDLSIDDNEKPPAYEFKFEKGLGFDEGIQDGLELIDYDDAFTTDKGGITYGLLVNRVDKYVCLVFRGTVGLGDIMTDRNFNLNKEFFFNEKYGVPTLGGRPATHAGFTNYLETPRKVDSVKRPLIDRIIASVDDVLSSQDQRGYRLFITGHSLGGGLANLCAFHAAHLKDRGDKSVKHWPSTIKALTFAAPVVGNDDFNKEYQSLEKKGVLRHIRVANQGDVVPTNNIPFPASLALKGSSRVYTQNGVNFFLRPSKKMDTEYRNTKPCGPELIYGNASVLKNHGLDTYEARLELPVNADALDETIEGLYEECAGDFTN